MKKILVYSFAISLMTTNVFALDTVFDSMDKATEVKLAPSISSSTASTASKSSNSQAQTGTVYKSTIKEEKFNSALVNLDDAQVELRQELATLTAKYNDALIEKEKSILNCKNIKAEIKQINVKMKNVEKSKKMINKNLQSTT